MISLLILCGQKLRDRLLVFFTVLPTRSKMNNKFKLGLFIFLIGFVGVLSTLTMDIPLPEEAQKAILELFSPWQLKLLNLINPTFFLLIAVALGIVLYDKIGLRSPILEGLIHKGKTTGLSGILHYGVIGGMISGVLILLVTVAFHPFLPVEFLEIGEKFSPGIAVRFLYGGLTEEILMRFGAMSFFVWLIFMVSGKLNSAVYWIGIVLSAILFGFGHLPMVYALVGLPTVELVLYIILGNAVGGIVFGWLYWKKGLEAAMVAHLFAHITMLVGESIFNI